MTRTLPAPAGATSPTRRKHPPHAFNANTGKVALSVNIAISFGAPLRFSGNLPER
jgi:hypothetical protein